MEPGSNKDGRNRKTNPSTTSNHPGQDSQKSAEDEHAVDKSVTSDSFFSRNDQWDLDIASKATKEPLHLHFQARRGQVLLFRC